MREAAKSQDSTRHQPLRASSARPSMSRAPLNPAQFTRWLVLILVLAGGLLGAALYLEYNGVDQTQAQLNALYYGVQEDLQAWWATPQTASVPAQAAAVAANSAPVQTASELGLATGCAANAPANPLAQGHAAVADALLGLLTGVLGKMMAISMLLMSLGISVVKASPAPALVGGASAGAILMGPSVVAQLMGCV